ncbi:PHA/PHB synthase family protein [Pseudonocardia sp. GCM10023141]|uniref:PHA/PHB synthase family protein n=1 Tax=Pseudonocardia sp. GCM10023141 TaxID=3252653 RepID=UPI00361640E7
MMLSAEQADGSSGALDMLLTDGALGPMRRLLPGTAGVRLVADLAGRPRTVGRRGRELAAELGRVLLGQSLLAPATRDRRFTDPAWTSNPGLRRIVQAYLAGVGTAEALLADAELGWRDRERLTFTADNAIAALSPSNNPLLSPEAWKALLDTGGGNVVAGVRNLLTDLAAAPRVPTMVKPDAFEVGVDLAVTPGAVVARTEVLELIRYTPQTPTVRARPLLIVPPVINKFYVADLAPGRSLVEYLVQGGQQVFMISWRNPDARHRDWDIDTYGREILDALDAARRLTGADAAVALGFCSGGTLLSMALAALAERGELDERVAGFGLSVCVLDQERAGTAGALLDEKSAAAATAVSKARGYLDGRALAEVFAWLRPGDLIWNYWVNNYLQGRDPAPFDILFWNADTTRMTAGLHRDLVELGLRNSLVRPGAATMLGSPVDLSAITTDGYVVAGVADHISPWQNCYRSARLFGGTTRFVLSTSGHIASIVNPPTSRKASHQVGDQLPGSASGWHRDTPATPGSWWPDYLGWLAARSGPEVPAPADDPAPLAAAPGTYVMDH